MKIHEFQAKRILNGFGVPVPRGGMACSPEEARRVAREIGSGVILKAQIHAGGRGKSGGIRTAATPGEALETAGRMIGMTLVTPQTGPGGRIVRKLLVEEIVKVRKAYYAGIVIDRAREAAVIMVSASGGVEIEKTAAEFPHLIHKEYIDPSAGLQDFQARRLAVKLGFSGSIRNRAAALIGALSRAFTETDASLIEINPLAENTEGCLLALDAKMIFDDNALPRHEEIRALRDPEEESPLEREASLYGLNYVKLDGNIGCMVNGAGLALATMDIINISGGLPANFLDVGGAASEDGVAEAFGILSRDRDVKAALINIFGGIVRCDTVARGIVRAARGTGWKIPVVVRMEGANAEAGKKILEVSGLSFIPAPDMKTAAEKAVALARESAP